MEYLLEAKPNSLLPVVSVMLSMTSSHPERQTMVADTVPQAQDAKPAESVLLSDGSLANDSQMLIQPKGWKLYMLILG